MDCRKTEKIAVLSKANSGYTMELNRVSFFGKAPKLDIRRWMGEQPMRGCSLSEDEAKALYKALASMYDGEPY